MNKDKCRECALPMTTPAPEWCKAMSHKRFKNDVQFSECIKTNDFGCEAREKLAKARGALMSILEDIEDGHGFDYEKNKLANIIKETAMLELCKNYPTTQANKLFSVVGELCGHAITTSHTTPNGKEFSHGYFIPIDQFIEVQQSYNDLQNEFYSPFARLKKGFEKVSDKDMEYLKQTKPVEIITDPRQWVKEVHKAFWNDEEALIDELTRLLNKTKDLAFEEAAKIAESQAPNTDDSNGDEYRRGQKRGALSSANVIRKRIK